MPAKNDVTGDSIRTKTGNQKAYADGWNRIFGKKTIEGSSNGRTRDFESRYVGSTPTPSTKFSSRKKKHC
jgi:hypothetical protein